MQPTTCMQRSPRLASLNTGSKCTGKKVGKVCNPPLERRETGPKCESIRLIGRIFKTNSASKVALAHQPVCIPQTRAERPQLREIAGKWKEKM